MLLFEAVVLKPRADDLERFECSFEENDRPTVGRFINHGGVTYEVLDVEPKEGVLHRETEQYDGRLKVARVFRVIEP